MFTTGVLQGLKLFDRGKYLQEFQTVEEASY